MGSRSLEIRSTLGNDYADVYTPEALAALDALAPLDADRKALMQARTMRRAMRALNRERITFLDPKSTIGRTGLTVQQARDGKFVGSEIPADLRRQWIQGTGPAARDPLVRPAGSSRTTKPSSKHPASSASATPSGNARY